MENRLALKTRGRWYWPDIEQTQQHGHSGSHESDGDFIVLAMNLKVLERLYLSDILYSQTSTPLHYDTL